MVTFTNDMMASGNVIPDDSGESPAVQKQNQQNFVHPTISLPPQKSTGSKVADALKAAGRVGENAVLGAAQGGYDIAKSVADILPGTTMTGTITGKQISKLPDVDLSKYLQGDGLEAEIPYGAGYLASQAVGDTGIYKGLGKIPGLAQKGFQYAAARGGITAALTGEQVPGGRPVAAALGAVTAPIQGVFSKPIAEDISSAFLSGKAKYNQLYGNWFEKLGSKDIGNMTAPDIDIEKLKPLSSAKKDYLSINRYLEEPSFENAQKAQSDLYKLGNTSTFGAPDSVREAKDYAFEARRKINGAGIMKLSSSGNSDLIPEYAAIQQGYKQEVVPYLNKDIIKYANGNMRPAKLLQKLSNNEDFITGAGQNHPDFLQQKLLKKYLKSAGSTAYKWAPYLYIGDKAVSSYRSNQ